MALKVIPYLLLLVAAALTFWLAKHLNTDSNATPSSHQRSPDYFSKDFKLTEMNPDGSPKQTLASEHLSHYDDNDTTYLKKPVLTLFDPIMPPWVIRSEMGNLSANGKNINLDGKVTIDRAANRKTKAIKIITRNLRVQPKIEYAETDEAVEITNPPHRVTGVGMRGYFTKDALKLSLLSNVQGKYEIQ